MRNLTLRDLKLGLRAMLGEHLPELQTSKTGKLYEPRLRAKQKAIDEIPDVPKGAPLAADLHDKDIEHDGLGAALHYFCLAVEAHPKIPAQTKLVAKHSRETLVPNLGVLRRNYADEAAAAIDNRKALETLENGLTSLKTPDGSTLFAWASDFVNAGDGIDTLLQARAKIQHAGEDASATAPLRAATIGLLGRFRDALRDEMEEDGSTLPTDHEAKLFAYLDKLAADRASQAPASPSPDSPEAPETSPT